MNAESKKLGAFLIAAFLLTGLFMVRPQKAEALLSLAQCFVAKATATAIGAGTTGANAALSVATNDLANATINTQTAGSAAGQEWYSCFLKGIAKIMAKTLLHTFTQSIVNWINGGFEGEPSFVTDIAGFGLDVADQAFGQAIEDVAPALCAPFRLDLKLALGLQASLRTQQEIRCRVTDVIANFEGVYNQFVAGGDFIRGGGWSSWINIAGVPQNNPYGAYIATQNYVGLRIVSATGKEQKLLDWGKGFKSWRSCKRYAQVPVNPNQPYGPTRKGKCVEEGEIRTPGSVIVDQASGTLGTTLRELESADEIDEIVGALVNQLLVKAMTGIGGLLGVSKAEASSGGVAATDTLVTDPSRAQALSEARVPAGIDCRRRYYADADPNNTRVWTIGEITDPNTGLLRTGLVEATDAVGNPIHRPLDMSWDAYFEQVRSGCANSATAFVGEQSERELSKVGEGAAAPGAGPAAPQEGNISRGKLATQSSTSKSEDSGLVNESTVPRAEYAADGVKEPYTFSLTGSESGERQWWKIDLETSRESEKQEWSGTKVSRIRIHSPVFESGGFRYPTAFRVFVSTTELDPSSPEGSGVTQLGSSWGAPQAGDIAFAYSATTPIDGRYLYIVADNSTDKIALSEVEVFGVQGRLGAGAPAPEAAFTFSSINPARETRSAPHQGDGFTHTVSLTPNKSEGGVSLKLSFFYCGAGLTTAARVCEESGYQQAEFASYFVSMQPFLTVSGVRTPRPDFITLTNGVPQASADPGLSYEGPAVIFAQDLSVEAGKPLIVALTGSLTTRIPLRLTLEARKDGRTVGTAIVNFATD